MKRNEYQMWCSFRNFYSFGLTSLICCLMNAKLLCQPFWYILDISKVFAKSKKLFTRIQDNECFSSSGAFSPLLHFTIDKHDSFKTDSKSLIHLDEMHFFLENSVECPTNQVPPKATPRGRWATQIINESIFSASWSIIVLYIWSLMHLGLFKLVFVICFYVRSRPIDVEKKARRKD